MGSTSNARLRSLTVTEPARQLTFDQQAGADQVLGVYAGLAKGTHPNTTAALQKVPSGEHRRAKQPDDVLPSGAAERYRGSAAVVLESFLLHSGGSMLNKDRTAPTLDSPASVQAIQWMTDLRLNDQITPCKGNPIEKGKGFDTGNAAMLVSDLTVRETLKKKPDLNFDIAPLPKGPLNNLSITGGGPIGLLGPRRSRMLPSSP